MGEGDLRPQQTGRSGRSRRGAATRRRRHPLIRFVLAAGLIVLIAAGGYAANLLIQLDETLDAISDDDSAAPVPKEERASQKPIVMLIFGLDSREAARTLNTDVIMALAVNPKTKKATILSIPRDLKMQPQGYRAQKANAFWSISQRYGKDEPGGPEGLVKRMFGELLGVPVDYLTVINFKAFESVIDELGGIEVDVDMDMCYIDQADGTNIRLKQGFQKLSGKEALDFVRYRRSSARCGSDRTAESSDFERNKRQQQVLSAMIDRMTSLGGLLKLDSVLKTVGDNVQTDIPKSQIKSMMLAYALIKKENIEFIALEGQWRSPYIHVDETKMNEVRNKLKEQLAAAPAGG